MTETLKPFKSVACTEISAQNVFDPDKNTPDSIVQIQEYKGKETKRFFSFVLLDMSPLLSRSSHPFVQGATAVQPVH